MPFINDNLDDEEQQGAGGAGEVKISGASPTTDAQGSTQPQPGANPQQPGKELKTGSGFQNLDKYLHTNQSQQFGQQVLGKVDNQVKDAGQKMGEASEQFKNTVQGANALPGQEQVQKALADPTNANAKDFQKWQSQSYEGPKSLAENQDSWNKYWSGTNQAESSAKQLGSESGRFALLDNYFGKPQYNFGEKSLDNLLVQQSGLGRETRNLQNQATQLRSQGNEQAKNLQGVAAERAGQVDQSRNSVNQAFGQAQTEAQGAVDQTWQQASAARAAEQDAIKQGLTSKSLSQDQLTKLGLSNGQSVFNLDLNKYLQNGGALSKEQSATDDQRARLNALAQLSGQQQTYLGDKSDASDAYGFDKAKFAADEGAAQSQFDQQWNTPTVQKPGETATSYAAMQSYVDQIKQAQALQGRDPNDPSTWQGTNGQTAADYVNRINAFKTSMGAGNKIAMR